MGAAVDARAAPAEAATPAPASMLAGRRLFLGALGAMVALAWAALWAWGRSPYGRLLGHERLGETGLGVFLPVFVGGWTVMTVAMMLPTSLPLLQMFFRIVQRRAERGRLVALVVLGYLGVWVLFGVAVHLGDLLLHEAAERSAWLEARPWAIPAGILVLAGVYQFTPLKYRCLDECRSPLSFITEHWQGRDERRQAFLLGAHHGLFCLGCCWSLMLLMFAVGVGNLGWMLALGAVMATEKNVRWGRRLSAPLGVALIAWGAAVAVLAAPALG